MKKIFYLMSLCALAFVSCQKTEIDEVGTLEGKYTYTLVGTASPEVKASVGDKIGNKWPMLWETGDKIGVYTADGATLIGVAEISAGDAGKNKAKFTLSTDQQLKAGQALTIKYPYIEGATASVPTKQSLAAANSSAGVGANAVATATTTYAGTDTAFELNYSNAYLRFVINSDEFKDYTLNGVTLWADGTELSGASEDYAKVTFAKPAVLGTGNNEVWMTANPVNLTGKKVWAIVHMTKGIETVTLPVELKGAANLPANAVTNVTLPKLTKSLAPAWYEPVETRYIAIKGDGWSYGLENTVLFPEKNAVKKVDLKARGNFMKVKKPAYVQIHYAADQSASQKSGYVKYNGTTDAYAGSSFIDHEVDSDCTVSVAIAKAYSADVNGQISAMLVKDADKNVIWGINLWACFNEIKTVQYQNGAVMTYNIGVSVDPVTYKNWKSNGCYFQWGRPFAFAWDANITNVNKELVSATQTFDYTTTKPYTFFYYSGEPYNWFWGDGNSKDRSGDLDDLWGNPNGEQNPGMKSIYDPCPKGYRVVSPALLAEVEKDLVSKVVTSSSPNYVLHEGVAWPFAGAYFGNLSSGNLAKAGNNNTTYMCAYWSNSNNAANGRMMSYQPSAAEDKRLSTGRARAAALPIRCMVDTENR